MYEKSHHEYMTAHSTTQMYEKSHEYMTAHDEYNTEYVQNRTSHRSHDEYMTAHSTTQSMYEIGHLTNVREIP